MLIRLIDCTSNWFKRNRSVLFKHWYIFQSYNNRESTVWQYLSTLKGNKIIVHLVTSSTPLAETLGRSCAAPCTSPCRWRDCCSWWKGRIQGMTLCGASAAARSPPRVVWLSADPPSPWFHRLLQRVYKAQFTTWLHSFRRPKSV